MANNAWIIAGVLIILAAALLVLMHPPIAVHGYAITSPLTAPVTVIFQGSLSSYSAPINSRGDYAVSLPGGSSYNVTIVYSAAISSGSNSCNAGTVYIATTPSTYSYNPSC